MTNRRHFLQTSAAAGALLALSPAGVLGESAPQRPAAPSSASPKPPPLDAVLVKEFVSTAHSDLPKTQRLLAEHPTLIHATWDWGGGDFETALGGASHMGRADIAEFLLSKGARLDVFALAMLGRLEALKAIVAAQPETVRCKGPHGITLVAHAKRGGPAAEKVLEFLTSQKSET